MTTNIARHCLLALAILALNSAPVIAADLSRDVQPIVTATQMLTYCSGVALKLGALKPPPDHAAARAQLYNNQAIAAGAATHAGEKPIRLSPENENFINIMESGKQQLTQCGQQLGPYTTKMPAHLQMLYDAIDRAGSGPKEMSQDDAKKLGAIILQYHDAHENFVKAIGALSNDQQVQSHLHEAILGLIKATTPTDTVVRK